MKILDFIQQSTLQEIQDLFSTATGLAAIAVDEEGKYITGGSNFTDFCMKYTRNSPIGKTRCEKCDAECTGTYFCHAGLMDFSEDIIVNGDKLGAIIGGQVLPAPPDTEKFEAIAEELSIPKDKYIEALKKVPIKTEQSIRASSKLLGQIVNTLVNLEYIKSNEHDTLNILDTEIRKATKSAETIREHANKLENIASKQKILALNATIEAARSGMAGAGFTVVASQMGSLTKDSTVIYNNIKSDANIIYELMTKMNKTLVN